MKAIYKFTMDCGRQGSLSGIFVAYEEQLADFIENEEIVFLHDVLGKHSEVTIDHKEIQECLTLVTTDPAFIELFEKFEMATGHSPFDYLEYQKNYGIALFETADIIADSILALDTEDDNDYTYIRLAREVRTGFNEVGKPLTQEEYDVSLTRAMDMLR